MSKGLCADGVYDFADAPERDARVGRVLWDTRACPSVLPLHVSKPARWLASVRSVARVDVTVVCRSGRHDVLVRQGNRRLQLVIHECPSAVTPLTEIVLSPEALRPRVDALSALNELLSRGRLPHDTGRPPTRSRRLTLLLRALDAASTGASHRDIARALFGSRRTERDWPDPRENLRDQVRRAIHAGRRLSVHAYRRLLK